MTIESTPQSLQHEPLEQALERRGWIAAQAGVHLRRLDDRARRGDKPVEPLGLVELRDRPALGVAGGDASARLEVLLYRLGVGVGSYHAQALLIELDPRLEELHGPREQD